MSAVDDFVDWVLAAVAEAKESPFAVGKVTVVTAGGAADGNALVTVNYNGVALKVTYGSHYTPVVGHVVFMARTQPLHIIDRIVGTPPIPILP